MSDSLEGRARAGQVLVVSLVAAVAVLRLWYCLLLPASTGDTLRHLIYGLLTLQRGLNVANLPLDDISTEFSRVAWPGVSFNYPILALLFDTAIAWIWPSLFATKLALTLIEGANAVLIWRWLNQKQLAVLYWISPISIWWVSREGQFEPLQNLFCILALGLLMRRRAEAWFVLSLAIQVKLFAVFLLPLFVFGAWKQRDLGKGAALFALGLLPTVAASFYYDAAGSFSRSLNMYFNPYYFDVFERRIFLWMPVWLIVCNQVASYGAIVALVVLASRSHHRVRYAGAIGFLGAIKAVTNAQFWYLVALPTLLLGIEERGVRRWLFLLLPLVDVYSLAQVLIGPFGYLVPPGYYEGITSLARISVTGR